MTPRSSIEALSLCSLALAVAASCASALGRSDPAPDPAQATALAAAQLELTTERVVVFKDGYALFVKRAVGVADERGRVHTGEVPDAAVLGSFWAAISDGRAPLVRAEWVETKVEERSERPCLTMAELLRANAGRTLTLELAPENVRVTGKVVEVLEHERREPVPPVTPYSPYSPYSSFARIQPLEATGPLELSSSTTFVGGQYVVLDQTPSGRMVLPISKVSSLSGEIATRIPEVKTVEKKEKRLSFDLGEPTAGQPVQLRIYYFRPGIRWIPTYRLNEIDPGPARLALQAELLNEAEDFENAALDLVVGFPNFRFKEVVSPLAPEAVLQNALQQTAPGLMSQSLSNAQFQARASEPRREGDAGAPQMPSEITSSGEQDLFVRSVPDFSLRKGARAAIPLEEERVERRHLYTLDIALERDPRSGPEGSDFDGPIPGSPLRKLPHQVWHQLELTNPGRAPWTTGSLLMMQQSLPVAQELLPYTSKGAKALVPMTVAVDVRAEHQESEIERQPNVLTWGNTIYSSVRKRGEIRLTNRRAEPIQLRVGLGLGGRASDASEGGSITLDDFRAGDWGNDSRARVNNHSDLQWTLELGPGESRTLSYLVQLYVY